MVKVANGSDVPKEILNVFVGVPDLSILAFLLLPCRNQIPNERVVVRFFQRDILWQGKDVFSKLPIHAALRSSFTACNELALSPQLGCISETND
jgi:hypothetical protein